MISVRRRLLLMLLHLIPNNVGPRMFGVLLPTITLLLDPSKSNPSPFHSLAVTQLLSFATMAPTDFKEATGKMDAAAREVLESSMRQALGTRANANQQTSKPQISLRSF